MLTQRDINAQEGFLEELEPQYKALSDRCNVNQSEMKGFIKTTRQHLRHGYQHIRNALRCEAVKFGMDMISFINGLFNILDRLQNHAGFNWGMVYKLMEVGYVD